MKNNVAHAADETAVAGQIDHETHRVRCREERESGPV